MARTSWIALISLFLALPSTAAEPNLRSTVTSMARISASWSPTFSRDGRTIAFVSDLSGTPQVWTVSSSGGFPVQVTALDDTVSSVDWSPDGEWLAVSAAPGGGMNQQVYLVSPDGYTVKRLTAGGKETNWVGPWNEDGSTLAFSSNTRSAAAMEPYLYDLDSAQSRKLAEIEGISRIVDIADPVDAAIAGRRVLLDRVAGRGDNNLYLLTGDREVLLTPHEGPASFAGRFSDDGEAVYVASNQGRDRLAFGRIDLEGGDADFRLGPIEILAERDDAELENFAIGPKGKLAVLVWNVGGKSELEMFDLEQGERRAIELSVDLVGDVVFARNGRQVAVVGRGATAPSDIYVLSLSSGTGKQLTFSPHPGVDLDRLVRPELVRFASFDGLELSGWLYRPRGVAEPAPYVLSFHGGPEGQERPSLRSEYQALLSQGIGVFAPNIRGSSGFGKRFVNLDNRELRFDANRDIAACAEYLVAQGIADRKRLGVMGGSYGGYAVMVAVTEFPKLFAAGVNLFGMVNFETFFANTEEWMAAISGTEYGDPVTERDLLRRLSPIHKLKQVETPLLVLHGANDTNVPVVEAEQVVETLKKRKVPVKYVLFPDEGHGFRKTPNRVTSAVETVEWFVKYLKYLK